MGFELVGRMRQVASKFGQSADVVTYQYFVGQPGTEQIARLTEQARRAGVRAIPLGQGAAALRRSPAVGVRLQMPQPRGLWAGRT